MNRFTKAAILITILIILSNALLIFRDFYVNSPNQDLTRFISSTTTRLLSIVIFSALLIAKLTLRKSTNYLFLSFFIIIVILTTVSGTQTLLRTFLFKLPEDQLFFSKNSWILFGAHILWPLMLIFLLLKRKFLKQDEKIYFLKKHETPVRIHFIGHGIGFLILLMMLIFNLIVSWPSNLERFVLGHYFLTISFVILLCLIIFAIYRQNFTFYFFAVCSYLYTLITFVVSIITGYVFSLNSFSILKNAEILVIYLLLTAFGVVLIFQARRLYRKLQPEEDYI